ncbi:ABC transporter ATP-binding protein [Alicyclobacillus cycloheptanicus]|uniref:ABC-2 type transport system ATP-binding protein n=1 Tax=Alicyclobacillus cycloheptanicus TaxID=1457 RepID=A0ABT9XEF3_9BACL|nr:ABC transporter ATP-binding protein [Alicyclobacillus cycloheptanicus]MDQ0188662.1 ABC-2 type transport system ATP-binding protein [Alicyclobacillus cycloheptanicus]WDM00664.1 ABC transporter ATP-binding protein [Alicyclobacillus cycloheptanicus]
MTKAVETVSLTKRFDARLAVDDVHLTVPEGSIYGVVGANGAGKSTLLRLILGTLWPTRGEVRLFGEPLPRESASFRQRVHFVGADGEMLRSFRVHELARYSSLLYERWDAARCDRLFKALELPRDRTIRNLSTGMKMQLRLAIALSAHPDLPILDEPTNGLDPVVKRQFLQLIVQEAAGQGTTVLLATHLLEDVERIADGMAVLYQGRVLASGVIDDLKGRVRRYQAALPGGLPPAIEDDPAVSRVERKGQVFTITVEGDTADIEQRLRAAGAPFVEPIELELSDLFRYLMEKEGYSRDSVLLS